VLVGKIPKVRSCLAFRLDAIARVENPVIRDHIYTWITTGNNVTKQTAAGRFRDLDETAISLMRKDSMNVIHDVGVSSGITSVELLRALQDRGIPHRFYISDRYARYGVSGRGLGLVRIFDADGALLEMYAWGVLAKSNLPRKFFLSRWLYALLARTPGKQEIRPFFLFDRQVMDYMERDLIHFIDYDVFETRGTPPFTFVRCMNLLNLSYFSPEKIDAGLRNIIGSLAEDGILQLGRTRADGHNMVGFYRKTGDGLQLVKEIGGGTELRDLLEKFLR
jgi:hypothetical protein